MCKTGSYAISDSKRNNSSLKTFVCTFLVFLALLLLIYLLMFALKGNSTANKKRYMAGGTFDSLRNNEKSTTTIRSKFTRPSKEIVSTTESITQSMTYSSATTFFPTTREIISDRDISNSKDSESTANIIIETSRIDTTEKTARTDGTTSVENSETTSSIETRQNPTIAIADETTNVENLETTSSTETGGKSTIAITDGMTNVDNLEITSSTETGEKSTIAITDGMTNVDNLETTSSTETRENPTIASSILWTTNRNLDNTAESDTTENSTMDNISTDTETHITGLKATQQTETTEDPTVSSTITTILTTSTRNLFLNAPKDSTENATEDTTTIETSSSTSEIFGITDLKTTQQSDTTEYPTVVSTITTTINTPMIPIVVTNEDTTMDTTSTEDTVATLAVLGTTNMRSLKTTTNTENPSTILTTPTHEANTDTTENATVGTTSIDTSNSTYAITPNILNEDLDSTMNTRTTDNHTISDSTYMTTAISVGQNLDDTTHTGTSDNSMMNTSSTDSLLTTITIKRNLFGTTEVITDYSETETFLPYRTTLRPLPEMPPCSLPACKEAASRVVALMNHDATPCHDFYDYACGGQIISEVSFFEKMFDGLNEKIRDLPSTSEEYLSHFSNFYRSCVDYETSFGMKKRLKFLDEPKKRSITDLFIDLILTQSMPFFDIGLGITNSGKYIFEVTIPNRSTLKTSLEKYSFLDNMREECLEESTEYIHNNTLDLKPMLKYIENCVHEKTKNYVRKYANEMNVLSNLPEMDFLGKFCKQEHVNGLLNLMKNLESLRLQYRLDSENLEPHNCRTINTSILNGNERMVALGFNWIDFFQGITKGVTISDDMEIKICHEDYLMKVFHIFAQNSNLPEILNLWSSMQTYKNTVVDRETFERETVCMRLGTELMPDIATYLLEDINADTQRDVFPLIVDIFDSLKIQFNRSMSTVNKKGDAYGKFMQTLQDIHLTAITPGDFDSLRNNYLHLNVSKELHQLNIKTLLGNYKKNIYSLVSQEVSSESLLKYFVNPFETEPRIFYPVKSIVFQPGFLHGISTDLPDNTRLATKIFLLAEQLVKYFMETETLKPDDSIRNLLNEFLHNDGRPIQSGFIDEVEYVFDGNQYMIKNTGCERQCLNSDELTIDNLAFKLATEIFKSMDRTPLMFLDEAFSYEQVFLLMTAQGFCKHNDLVNFLKDFSDGKLPSPMKIRNIMKNSYFFETKFHCYLL
ncbi:uncharacterized protein isoform X2 [Leptinotarsa decemlineata]|uniref:uncharacterized protein isoform X2 n=1 Tax=Leptinotarsa decemlineata TaxID=7539 RepID=UPI003D308B47